MGEALKEEGNHGHICCYTTEYVRWLCVDITATYEIHWALLLVKTCTTNSYTRCTLMATHKTTYGNMMQCT